MSGSCLHEEFKADVAVARLEDTGQFMVCPRKRRASPLSRPIPRKCVSLCGLKKRL